MEPQQTEQPTQSNTEEANYGSTQFESMPMDIDVIDKADAKCKDVKMHAAETTADPPKAIAQGSVQEIQFDAAAVHCEICKMVKLTKIYQCRNGHLFCNYCHIMLSFTNERCLCPGCDTVLDHKNPVRNRLAENIISKLFLKCEYCKTEIRRDALKNHLLHDCTELPCECEYSIIGCSWMGPRSALVAHQENCTLQHKTGQDLHALQRKRYEEIKRQQLLFESMCNLMKSANLKLRLLQLLPQSNALSLDCIKMDKFSAYANKWRLYITQQPKADGTHSLAYYLKLCTKKLVAGTNLPISYTILPVLNCEAQFDAQFSRHDFNLSHASGPSCVFLSDTKTNCLAWLQEKGIQIRLLMSLNVA